MAFNEPQLKEINKAWDAFLLVRRPPEEIRHKVDIGMKIENHSIIIHEIRPIYVNPSQIIHSPVAKVIFTASSGEWKIYWMRANLKWYRYDPKPTVRSFKAFLKEVAEDPCCCFWG